MVCLTELNSEPFDHLSSAPAGAPLLSNFHAFIAVFSLQRRLLFTVNGNPVLSAINSFSLLLSTIPIVATVAWIANGHKDPVVIAYLAVGTPLMVIWNNVVFRSGFMLLGEILEGTLDLALVSRTPLILLTLSKTAALIVFTTILGAIGAFTAFIIMVDAPIYFPSLVLIVAAFAVATISVAALSFLFAPIGVLVAGRPGFMNAIFPAGVVLSGFLYPIAILPPAVEAVARALPTAWAMDAVMRCIRGSPVTDVLQAWGVALALSGLYIVVTYFMFRATESRIRINGSVATS